MKNYCEKSLKKIITAGGAIALLAVGSSAYATTMEYTDTDNGGGNYTLEFTVINDTLTEDIGWFSIFFGQKTDYPDNTFDFLNFDQFTNFSPDDLGNGSEPQPAGWDSYSFEFSSIELPGQFNSDAMVTGITPGDSLGGFTVSFDWTGVGSYDHLYFEVGSIDANGNYNFLDSGFTTEGGNAPVPEPATMLLFGTGLGGFAFFRKIKTKLA